MRAAGTRTNDHLRQAERKANALSVARLAKLASAADIKRPPHVPDTRHVNLATWPSSWRVWCLWHPPTLAAYLLSVVKWWSNFFLRRAGPPKLRAPCEILPTSGHRSLNWHPVAQPCPLFVWHLLDPYRVFDFLATTSCFEFSWAGCFRTHCRSVFLFKCLRSDEISTLFWHE